MTMSGNHMKPETTTTGARDADASQAPGMFFFVFFLYSTNVFLVINYTYSHQQHHDASNDHHHDHFDPPNHVFQPLNHPPHHQTLPAHVFNLHHMFSISTMHSQPPAMCYRPQPHVTITSNAFSTPQPSLLTLQHMSQPPMTPVSTSQPQILSPSSMF
jgi:hypothetical protein